jgi:nitrate reductase delta subunit
VAFWTEGDRRHQFKIFKPAAEVSPADLPYSWMKDGLVVPEGFSCDCC